MSEQPIMVGQTYRRLSGPPLWCEVRRVNAPREGWAMCEMHDAEKNYGVKPAPFEVLRSFALESGPGERHHV